MPKTDTSTGSLNGHIYCQQQLFLLLNTLYDGWGIRSSSQRRHQLVLLQKLKSAYLDGQSVGCDHDMMWTMMISDHNKSVPINSKRY